MYIAGTTKSVKNVPIDIRNLMFFYKNNMSLKNLKDVVEELNSKLRAVK